jgi:hypothetical protein
LRFEGGRKYLLRSFNILRNGFFNLNAKQELALNTSRVEWCAESDTAKIISAQWEFVKERLAFAHPALTLRVAAFGGQGVGWQCPPFPQPLEPCRFRAALIIHKNIGRRVCGGIGLS